jgi:hypothetical protein
MLSCFTFLLSLADSHLLPLKGCGHIVMTSSF